MVEFIQMQDEVKLIYFYQLGAKGFRKGDPIDNNNFFDVIAQAMEYGKDEYRLHSFTVQKMSKIILNWLCRPV